MSTWSADRDPIPARGAETDNELPEPASARRINAAAKLLVGHPEDADRVLRKLEPFDLANLAEVIRQIERQRAVDQGDHGEIIDLAFEEGFASDGLGHLPWIEGSVVVCPGGIITKSKANHRCRFISVNDSWVWDCQELLREDKRSTPGTRDGFRAIALVPVMNGMSLDVVYGKARGGQHQVEKVISFAIKRGKLVEVAQRNVTPAGMK